MMSAMNAVPHSTSAVDGPSLSADQTETQVGAWLWDFESPLFSIDAPWCSTLGLSACEGADHLERWAKQIHPDDVSEFRRKCDAVRSGRLDRFEIEYRVLAADGRWIWLLQRGRVERPSCRARAVCFRHLPGDRRPEAR